MKKLIPNYAFNTVSYSAILLHASNILLVLQFAYVLFSPLPLYAIAPTPSSQHYVIVLDNSGSMQKGGASLRAWNLISEFQSRLKLNDRFTLISFGATPRIILQKKFTSDDSSRGRLDNNLLTFSEMFTDLHGGFSFLLDFLDKNKNEPDQTIVLFLTDGLLDLVGYNDALFPESIKQVTDYKELFSRYAPYIEKNRIKRDKIAAFNKEVNSIGVNIFTREIIPKLKDRTTPLFILTFADQSNLLHEISKQIALREGMNNYFLILEDKDRQRFLDTFFNYVVRLEKMKVSGQFAEASNINPTNQEIPQISSTKYLPESKQNTDHRYAILTIVLLGITTITIYKIRRFPSRSDKIFRDKSVAVVSPEKAAITAAPVTTATAAEEPPEIVHSSSIRTSVGKISVQSDTSDKENQLKPEPCPPLLPAPIKLKEYVTNKESPIIASEELKNELLLMDKEELLGRLKRLDEFQLNALAETDEYLNSLLHKLKKELNTNLITKLAITDNRHSFRHSIPEEYPLYFVFSSQEFTLQGKVLDISQDGVGLATSSSEVSTLLDGAVNGDLTLLLDTATVALMPAYIAYFDTATERFGISSLGLKKNPDLKLHWLETFTKILDDLKRLKNDNT